MKLKNSLYAGAVILAATAALASCSGKQDGDSNVRQLSDYKDLTAGDSVAYYFGQMSAIDYWRAAKADTTLMSQEARDQYLKGLNAGYEAIRSNDAYNMGYYKGVQLAMQMKQFSEDYDVTVNKKVILNAMADGLKADSLINEGDAQKGFTDATNALELRKQEKDRQEAAKALNEMAGKNKWQAINPDLYAGPAEGAQGAPIKEGEHVGVSVTFKNPKGQDIDRRENPDMIIGKMMPGPVTQALLTMKVGQTRTFYASAQAVFGRFCQRYSLKGSEIVSFTITTKAPVAQPTVTDEAGN